MHAVLQESISGVYADLVTRPTGRVVRERIERAIAGGSVGEITVARFDFTGVGCIDYSCADEIVAKLLRDRFAVLVLSGITDGHREAIEPVLSGHGLAALIERADGTLESLGAAAAAAALLDELVARRLAAPRPGDHLLSSEWIYGGVQRLFAQEFGRFGIDVSFVGPLESRTWKRALKKNTRAIFVETPTNPLLRVLDLEPIATLCKTEGLALLVDSTFATPINFRPLEHGADVVIHSATKYLNGHTDVIAGAVAGTESVIEEVRKLLHVWGQALDPMAAWLIDRGMKTLAVSVVRQNQTALAVAQWCATQSQFAAVHYPGLPSHADYDVATRILNGFGGMLGVELKGGARAAERFLRALTIATHAPSLGGVETHVSEPRLTSHSMLTPEARARAGIADGFLRFSIGLEDADDIIADFAQALAQQ